MTTNDNNDNKQQQQTMMTNNSKTTKTTNNNNNQQQYTGDKQGQQNIQFTMQKSTSQQQTTKAMSVGNTNDKGDER